MDYESSLKWLYETQLFGIKLGLENMDRLLQESGLSEALEGREIIHVAGTNGKGSVCAMAEAVLRAGGVKTGLFTSPHLVTFRERIRVDGRMIPETEVARGLTELRERVERWEAHPTFFELTLALAVKYFCDQEVEVLVVETGMGGRLDATNRLRSSVAVITPIGLDHTQWLGETLGEIAGEKAGIIEEGRPVLSAEQAPEAAEVLERVAKDKGADLRWVASLERQDPVPALAGDHQRANAALAVAAVREIRPDLEGGSVARGLAEVDWPARFQRIGRDLVVDGAHNADATAALVSTWREEFGPDAKAIIVFGGVGSKDTAEVLRLLKPLAARLIFVKVASRRGLPVADLESAWQSIVESEGIGGGEPIAIDHADDASVALEKARSVEGGDSVLVTGSLYLAGEALAALRGGPPFEVSEQ